MSNFRVEDIRRVLAVAHVKPAVNQLELHPYLQQPEVYALCRENGIVVVRRRRLRSTVSPPVACWAAS